MWFLALKFKLLLLHLVHAELKTPWGKIHPRHHRAHIEGVEGIMLVLRLVERVLCVTIGNVLPTIVDMSVEHGIATITPVPCVEGIVRQYQPCAIPQVLLLVVLYLHELVSEVVVVKELIVVVSQYQMLLPLQVLQQPNRRPNIMNGDVTQDEHMVVLLHNAIPVLDDSVVKLLWSVQLVTGECYLILGSSYWTRVSLVPEMNVRYVEAIGGH